MIQHINKEREKLINDFNKFVSFLSLEFKVKVELNGKEASTNGRVITLPDLMSLSPREIKFLYGVLTHEVGHVEYSDFSTEKFKMIKNENHFSLVNALEDARVENLMMLKYDGAHDLFHSLYNEFMLDEKFVYKNFGFKKEDFDLLKGIGCYLHNYFVKLKQKPSIKNLLGAKLEKQVNSFIAKNDLGTYLSLKSLNSWSDVIDISSHVYNLYFSKKNDQSPQNFIPNMENKINEIVSKSLPQLVKDHVNFNKDQEKLYDQLQTLQNKANEVYNQNKEELDSLKANKDKLSEKINKINNFNDLNTLTEKLEDHLKSKNKKVETKQLQRDNLLDKMTETESQLSEAQLIPDNDAKIKELSEKLESRINAVIKADELLDKYNENLMSAQNNLKSHLDEIEQLKKELQSDNIEKLKEKTEKELKTVNDKYESLCNKISEYQNKVTDKQSEINQKEEEHLSQMGQEFKKLQNIFDENDIPVNLIPQFEELEGWDEANALQQEFDTRASAESGEIVVNGTGLGSGNRNILLVIDQTSSNLKEIDLAKIFKEKYKVSKLDQFNNECQINNTLESDFSNEEEQANTKMHIPLTKEFDKIITSNIKNESVKQIRQAHFKIIKKTKEIFSYKMKSKKKDHFKGNKEEGYLDTRNLWKLATRRDNHYFEVNQPKPQNDVVASIAIDVSGSMDKDATASGQKVKELTTFISDALEGVFVKHEICAFHAPINHQMREMKKSTSYNRVANSLETIVYKKFTDKSNETISGLELKCSDNSDGESIKIIASRLIRERAKRRVLFIISDNKPFLTESDISTLDKDLQNTILWCRQNRVEVYAFGFNDLGAKYYQQNYCHVKNYDDFIQFCQQKILAK